MDQSLDQIIQSKPRVRRGATRRGSARAAVLGKPVSSPASRARATATATVAAAGGRPGVTAGPADKIIVSNLPPDVNETQIKELFSSTVGYLREVTLHYDAAGRSKGVASVHFLKKGDASKAYQQYNNRLIDGLKPMKIEIVVAPAGISLASRVAPAPAVAVTTGPTRTPGARGGRRRGRGGKAGGGRKEPKTAADLDAEMEDYTASNAPPAATTAAA